MQKVLESLRKRDKPRESSDIISRAKAACNQYLKQMEESNLMLSQSSNIEGSEMIDENEESKQSGKFIWFFQLNINDKI